MSEQRLMTLKEYQSVGPRTQGYIVYMQADWPGSELKGQTNPYPTGSAEHVAWNKGQRIGVQIAQDSEE